MYKGKIPWQRNSTTGEVTALTYPVYEIPANPDEVIFKWGVEYFWKDNIPFKDALVVKTYSRGRSAANIIATSKVTGTSYSFFMSDFLDVLQEKVIVKGEIEESEWAFIKKGANYGLQLYKNKV